MSTPTACVVIQGVGSIEELREIIRDTVRTAIPLMQPATRWKWYGPAAGPRHFGISPKTWLAMIASGQLPHTMRPCRGGKLTPFVRETDAIKALAAKAGA